MTAKANLRAWITAHATTAADAAEASSLVAAYVAECVRADRATQRDKAQRVEKIREQFRTIADDIFGSSLGTKRPR